MSPRDWNASSYDAISAPQQAWGATVVGRLELRGDETVSEEDVRAAAEKTSAADGSGRAPSRYVPPRPRRSPHAV